MSEDLLNKVLQGLKSGGIYRVSKEQLEDIDTTGAWYKILHQRFDNGVAMITGVNNKVIDLTKDCKQ